MINLANTAPWSPKANRILALDQRGILLHIDAIPKASTSSPK